MQIALERALAIVLVLMSMRSEILEIEVRWLLRAPAVEPKELLERWQAATVAFQSRHPIRKLEAELQDDHSCIRLTLSADGWEEWEGTDAEPLKGTAAPLCAAWLLGFVRYGFVPTFRCNALTQAQAGVLLHEHQRPEREQPARLRQLSMESGAFVMLLHARPSANQKSGAEPPRLLVVGPRSAVKRAGLLLKACDERSLTHAHLKSLMPVTTT